VKASVSPEADRELSEGASRYAREAAVEIAEAFIDEYERVIALLCAYPDLGARWRGRARRFPLRKFPYSVIYYVRDQEVRVVAIAHHRRKPDYWTGRR
jgi:plasmid stabilization system protein ParE